jgi:hypothetical protein
MTISSCKLNPAFPLRGDVVTMMMGVESDGSPGGEEGLLCALTI